MKLVSPESLSRRLHAANAPVLVECLPYWHYETGHLPGALNINYHELPEKAPRLLPDLDAEIVVYCVGLKCFNAQRGAAELEGLGYRNVRVLRGGKARWQASGRPLEQSH